MESLASPWLRTYETPLCCSSDAKRCQVLAGHPRFSCAKLCLVLPPWSSCRRRFRALLPKVSCSFSVSGFFTLLSSAMDPCTWVLKFSVTFESFHCLLFKIPLSSCFFRVPTAKAAPEMQKHLYASPTALFSSKALKGLETKQVEALLREVKYPCSSPFGLQKMSRRSIFLETHSEAALQQPCKVQGPSCLPCTCAFSGSPSQN